MAGHWNSWPREDFQRHIFEAVLKLRQLNVALQKSHQFLASCTCDQPRKRSCDIVGCVPELPPENRTVTEAIV